MAPGETDLRVALDALAFGAAPAGVGRYVTTLLQGFAAIGRSGCLTLVCRHEARSALAGFAVALAGPGPRSSRMPWRALWEQVALGGVARRAGAALVHGLMGAVPLATRLPRVVTIHDVTFLTHPEVHEPGKVRYFRSLLPLAARVSRRILTDSEASAQAIERALGVARDRIAVVPLAVDPGFVPAPPAEIERVRRERRIPDPYVLYAGVLEPRKNLPLLIEAMLLLRLRGYPHRLVLAGKAGWGMAPIERAVERAGDAVIRLGYVPDGDLRALLGGADAFAYLPLAEGFGLPVAEALACGVPVVTSDRSSLPEVAGGAALLCDPTDPAAVAAALARILDDPALRADLALRGLARAAELSPRALALGTLAAYELALAARSGPPRGAA